MLLSRINSNVWFWYYQLTYGLRGVAENPIALWSERAFRRVFPLIHPC